MYLEVIIVGGIIVNVNIVKIKSIEHRKVNSGM